MKLYGSDLCPDCPPVIEYLKKKSVEFEFVNITESMKNLKEFTALRDHRVEFEDARKNGYMGIPCLLTDEAVIFFEEDILKNF